MRTLVRRGVVSGKEVASLPLCLKGLFGYQRNEVYAIHEDGVYPQNGYRHVSNISNQALNVEVGEEVSTATRASHGNIRK